MTASKIETTIGMCVVALTRHIMERAEVKQEVAYKKLLETELYKLLNDEDTRLYLETNEYLCQAYEQEFSHGKEALYDFINQ